MNGSETIEGLALNMLKFEKGTRSEEIKTSSLVKLKNLKFLQFDYVRLTGTYEDFPSLRWLSWRRCNLKTIPRGLYLSSLVALHLSHGDFKEFEPPMVLNSLKILDLSFSYKLVSIRNLHRLPKLVDLGLGGCRSLTHVCKNIGDLENLASLNFAECPKLLKTLFICEAFSVQPLFSLPQSLRLWNLAVNSFELLPNYVDLKMLHTLNLNGCSNLKSLLCLPSTLKVLHVCWCTSLENISFQSARFTLQLFTYEGCLKLCEIEGLFKLVSIAKLDGADLGYMQWVKVYQDHKVDLVGDMITMGRTLSIQMLYEYGIRSIYLQGIKDKSMAKHEYTTSSGYLSFRVPLHPKKHRIQGLNVTILYKLSGGGRDIYKCPPLFVQICNTTKGLSWVYSPVVYCKPRVNNYVVWLSYWPIRNILDAGDEVYVRILAENGTIRTRGCGASLVYIDDGDVEKEEKCEGMKGQLEVIGGDLSLFEVTKGGYYLCRRDFYLSRTPDMLKSFFDNFEYRRDSRRWRVTPHELGIPFEEANTFRNPNCKNIKAELGVSFNSDSEPDKIVKAVSGIVGVKSVSIQTEVGRLIVCGRFDVEAVVTCVRKFEKLVQVVMWKRV